LTIIFHYLQGKFFSFHFLMILKNFDFIYLFCHFLWFYFVQCLILFWVFLCKFCNKTFFLLEPYFAHHSYLMMKSEWVLILLVNIFKCLHYFSLSIHNNITFHISLFTTTKFDESKWTWTWMCEHENLWQLEFFNIFKTFRPHG
jgi:hypothetical protein